METTTLWHAYLQEGDLAARDSLLAEHLGLVRHVARQMSRSLNVEANFDELVSAGSVGLMNALDSFDPERGLAFSTFAAPRIRGAILDDLRRQDHVSRSIRRKSREMTAAREALMRQHGRAPEQQEIATQMGVDLETFWRWESEVEGVFHMSLDQPRPDGETSSPFPIDLLTGETGNEIESRINLQQESEHLRDAILGLKEQERVVLSLYYYEELKLLEIASILELTESRVSQIRSRAISKLRAEMAPLREKVA